MQEITKEISNNHNDRIRISEEQKKTMQKTKKGAPKINEIVKSNPAIENKRRERYLKVMKGNLYHLKTGEYAKNIPLYCNSCYAQGKCPFYLKPKKGETIVCAIREEFAKLIPLAKTRDKDALYEMLDRLREIQANRASLNLYFETLDGGVQDKALSTLLAILTQNVVDAIRIHQPAAPVVNQNIVNVVNEIKNDPAKAKELYNAIEAEVTENGN